MPIIGGGSSGGASGSSSPGFEINYTQITAGVNIVSVTEASGTTVLSPGAITFDGTPVLVHFFSPYVGLPTNAAGSDLVICLFEGATQIGRLAELFSPAVTAQEVVPVSAFYRFTPSAALHTYTVTAFVNSTTGTPVISAGSGGTANRNPAFVRFTKV